MAGADIYSVTMQNQTIVADETLVILHTSSTLSTRASNIEILRAWCGQHGTATSQDLGVMIAQKASAFGTYTSTAPVSHFIGGSSSGLTGGTAGAAGTADRGDHGPPLLGLPARAGAAGAVPAVRHHDTCRFRGR